MTLPHEPDDIAGLNPSEYHRIVAPALKTAAQVAAARGDPLLVNDMASMLALWHVADLLAQHELADPTRPPDASPRGVIETAARGACVMVLQQAELDRDAITDCLDALSRAHAMLGADGIFDDYRDPIARAWHHLREGHSAAADSALKRSVTDLVAAIDAWEAARGG